MACCCLLSRQTVRHLKINTPQWLVIVGLRLATALVACLIIAAFVVCISVPGSVVKGGSSSPWQWGDIWMESLAFVPVCPVPKLWYLSCSMRDVRTNDALNRQPAVSLLQTLVTITYLLSTTHLVHPVVELVIELTIVLVTAFPIVFCATVSGPLQQWQKPQSDVDELKTPGIMELVGFIGLCLIEVFHFGFFIWASCRAHIRRREKIMRSRAAAMKLEAGWGFNEEDDAGMGVETRYDRPQPRKESRRQIDLMGESSFAGLGLTARKESNPSETLNSARLPSTVSALSAWDGKLSPGARRPSSLELMPQGRRPTEPNQIGVAIGKPHEIWVPITELRSESPFSAHRVVDDHEVVIVGDGEVKVVSTPRQEVFMGFKLPEPSTPRLNNERKGLEKHTEADAPMRQNSDPDIPPPLKVRKSIQQAKSFKLGNSWEIEEESKSRPPVIDQGW